MRYEDFWKFDSTLLIVQDHSMNNVKVYRSGIVSTPASRGVETESYVEADAVRPAGRQGRTDGIFAAPTLSGVTRWAYSNASNSRHEDPFVREIAVNPDSVYVYSIEMWENCSWAGVPYEEYWKTGVTLTEWLNNQDQYDATNWELLLSPEDVVSVKNVSDKRLIASAENGLHIMELPKVLKKARRAVSH